MGGEESTQRVLRNESYTHQLDRGTDPTAHPPSSSVIVPPSFLPSLSSSRKQYAMLGTSQTMLFVVGVGSLPFTRWSANAEGVPLADEWIYGLVLIVFLTSCTCGTMFYGGMYSSFDPPVAPKLHFGWATTWKVRMPVATVSGAAVTTAILLSPLALGESPRFFFLDSVAYMVGFPICLITGEIASRWSTGSKAPVRQSVRRLSQHALLLYDDEGEAMVSDVNDHAAILYTLCARSFHPPASLLSLSLPLRIFRRASTQRYSD